jgi:hypothetical protein
MEYNKTCSISSYGDILSLEFGLFAGIMMLFRCLLAALFSRASFASSNSIIEYSTVPGYFLQDLNTTDASSFDFVSLFYL